MPSQATKSWFAGASLFVAGWLAAQAMDGKQPVLAQSPAATAASELMSEQFLYALAFGVATVAVDAEVATIRLNELQDRHTALERRIAQIEAQIRR